MVLITRSRHLNLGHFVHFIALVEFCDRDSSCIMTTGENMALNGVYLVYRNSLGSIKTLYSVLITFRTLSKRLKMSSGFVFIASGGSERNLPQVLKIRS